RMIRWQCRFASLRLAKRNATGFAECIERTLGAGEQHAAACNDERTSSAAHKPARLAELPFIRTRSANVPDALLKEALRIIERFRLDILAERQRDGPTRCGICQHIQGARERRTQLFRTREPIEIARDR